MIKPKCPKCECTKFIETDLSPENSNVIYNALVCSDCHSFISSFETTQLYPRLLEIDTAIEDLAMTLDRIEKKIDN